MPGISVSREASSPPVQLSAVASRRCPSQASRSTRCASASIAGGRAGSRASAIGLLDRAALAAAHLAHQLSLARLEHDADRLHVHVGLLELRKVLGLLFLDMVLDLLLEDGHLGVVQLLAWLHGFDLGDQLLGGGMLDHRLVDYILVIQKIPAGGVEDLLLDLSVYLQFQADLLGEHLL